MQIPRRVRIAFREELVGWYLRAIDDLFQAEGFRPGPDNPAVSGERRSRVEQYYSAVDWNSPDETSRVLRVFEEVLAGTENSEGRQNLIAVLQRDGFEVDDSGRIRRPGSETLAGLIERSDLPTGVGDPMARVTAGHSDPPVFGLVMRGWQPEPRRCTAASCWTHFRIPRPLGEVATDAPRTE